MLKFVLLTQGCRLDDGRTVKRIMAMRDFGNVKRGDIGGFVEWTNNLSHEGDCWIADDAIAAGWSRVSGDALLRDRVLCDGYVSVSGRAVIGDDALLEGRVAVSGDAQIGLFSYLKDGVDVRDHATIFCRCRYSNSGKTRVPNLFEQATVRGHAKLEGRISMSGTSTADDHVTLCDNVRLRENSYAGGCSVIEDQAHLFGNAKAIEHARICGRSKLSGNVLAAGHSVVKGKSLLLCNVYVGGTAIIENETLSGDMYRTRTS